MTTLLQKWCRWLAIQTLKCGPIPKHIAFIMDGNRRFARKIHADVRTGHYLGHEKLKETLEWCLQLGVETVTVFAFSIENFKRPKEEVDALMELAFTKFTEMLSDSQILGNHRRIRIFGDISRLPLKVQQVMAKAMYISRHNTQSTLNICMAYTSTEEMTRAVNRVVGGVCEGLIQPDDVTEYLLSQCMYSCGCSDPDVIVRTSGEMRLSDFLLWQGSFSALVFFNVYWPEFSLWHLYKTVFFYQHHYHELQFQQQKYREMMKQCGVDLVRKRCNEWETNNKETSEEDLSSNVRVENFLKIIHQRDEHLLEELSRTK